MLAGSDRNQVAHSDIERMVATASACSSEFSRGRQVKVTDATTVTDWTKQNPGRSMDWKPRLTGAAPCRPAKSASEPSFEGGGSLMVRL